MLGYHVHFGATTRTPPGVMKSELDQKLGKGHRAP
jgi:hypothetical protein